MFSIFLKWEYYYIIMENSGLFMKLNRISKGFTLIELMVVIVIIGILVAIALPNFAAAQNRAKLAAVKSNAKTLQVAVESYNIDQGVYPDRFSNIMAGTGYKVFKNPFNGFSGLSDTSSRGAWRVTEYGTVGSPGDLMNNFNDSWATKGLVLYIGLNTDGEATTTLMAADGNKAANPSQTVNYMIVGCDDNGRPIRRFLLSSGNITPLGMQLLTTQ
jgi:prepilin-type N-terminal cleavage/methylation domain-containing protein